MKENFDGQRKKRHLCRLNLQCRLEFATFVLQLQDAGFHVLT